MRHPGPNFTCLMVISHLVRILIPFDCTYVILVANLRSSPRKKKKKHHFVAYLCPNSNPLLMSSNKELVELP